MHDVLTHPKYVKAIKGNKTDKRDVKWIANLFRFDIVKASFIPTVDIRALRELSYMHTAEKKHYQNSMTISYIRIDCVLTDPAFPLHVLWIICFMTNRSTKQNAVP